MSRTPSPDRSPPAPTKGAAAGGGMASDVRLAAIHELCVEQGLRLTRARRLVCELLIGHPEPVTAYVLLDEMRDQMPQAKPPTVYRALEFLIRAGVVHRIAALNAFVLCNQPERTHEPQIMVCDDCARVVELRSQRLSRVISSELGAHAFAARAHAVVIQGVCDGCAVDHYCATTHPESAR